jgi:hypothetical protein
MLETTASEIQQQISTWPEHREKIKAELTDVQYDLTAARQAIGAELFRNGSINTNAEERVAELESRERTLIAALEMGKSGVDAAEIELRQLQAIAAQRRVDELAAELQASGTLFVQLAYDLEEQLYGVAEQHDELISLVANYSDVKIKDYLKVHEAATFCTRFLDQIRDLRRSFEMLDSFAAGNGLITRSGMKHRL